MRFAPGLPQLMVQLGTRDAPSSMTATMAATQIAVVAFRHEPTGPRLPPLPEGGKFLVHVAGGRALAVVMVPTSAPIAAGFYARPAEPDSPFAGMFFYDHGVSATEIAEPIGALLVKDGLASSVDVERGLSAQKEARDVPIGQILLETQKVTPDVIAKACDLQKSRRLRLGEILQQEGLVKAEDIDAALAEQKKRRGRRLGEILVAMGIISEISLAQTLSKKFNLPLVDLDEIEISKAALAEIPPDMLEKYQVIPLHSDPMTMTIAIADPMVTDGVDALRFFLRKQINEVMVTVSQLRIHLAKILGKKEVSPEAGKMDSIIQELTLGIDTKVENEFAAPEETVVGETDSAIVKLTNQIILTAYQRGVSDIHIEPNGRDDSVLVRFRADGDCYDYQEVPSTYRNALVSRLKIMANLDISERRKPQDGKIKMKLTDDQIELRVATIPTVNQNEDVVMRILAASKPMPLDKMGLSARNLKDLQELIRKPYGLVLCVGPTGSGKTTTLHSALGSINTKDLKIWTAEDPVEITQKGLRQVQVKPKLGFTFATAMRAFLRADPDVIMIGEMRDEETASIAVEASLTGHLVMSTLHTNSAPETITRLVDMGMEPFSFADALLGVLAQRLARGLCKRCREPYTAKPEEQANFIEAYGGADSLAAAGVDPKAELKLWRGVGCAYCGNSGYKGRVALHELLVSNDELKTSIQKKSPVHEIRTLAMKAGMRTLLQDGAEKALLGLTDLTQVLAVCSR